MSRKHKDYSKKEDQIILDEVENADKRPEGFFKAFMKLDGRSYASVQNRFYRKLLENYKS